MLISEEYRRLNAEKHQSSSAYGSSGSRIARLVVPLAIRVGAETVLDYGCGKGSLKAKLDRFRFAGADGETRPMPFEVLEYDPAIQGKQTKPDKADLVVCGDVLEHVEPCCLYSVLDDIRSIARKAVLFVVATCPANKYLADGRNAHLIVERAEWWMPKFDTRWALDTFENHDGEFLLIGRTI